MTSQRIAIYAPYFSQTPAGLETYMREVIKHLSSLGHDMVLYTASPQHAPRQLPVHPLPAPSAKGPLGGLARQLSRLVWMRHTLAAMMKRDKRTLLLSLLHEGMINPAQRQIIVIHDLMPLIFPHERSGPLVAYYRHILPRLVRRSATVAVSQNTRADVERFYGRQPEPIHVIPEAFDRDLFRPDGRRLHMPPSIFYTGTHWPHKNLGRLLRAYARIARQIPHQLVIGGGASPAYTPALQRLARELHISERITWTGYLARETLAQTYRSVDCFAYPSLYEGFGLPPLEALASGAAVVAANTSSIPEVVGDAAVLHDPQSIDELAVALLGVCTNPDYRSRARARGLAQADRFRWEHTAQQLIELCS